VESTVEGGEGNEEDKRSLEPRKRRQGDFRNLGKKGGPQSISGKRTKKEMKPKVREKLIVRREEEEKKK